MMSTSSIGIGRGVCEAAFASQTPYVECCLIHGTGQTIITGSMTPAVQEEVTLATAWARLYVDSIKTALALGGLRVTLPLPPNRDLFINLSPGSSAWWKDRLLGGAICVGLVSLMTGLHPKPDVAIVGTLHGSSNVLGEVIINSNQSQPLWRSLSGIQGIRQVIVGKGAVLERTYHEAGLNGVDITRADSLTSALSHVFQILTP